ncbi:tripartite tricarboxylate transporter substrate-binding protein [Pseudomonas sp. HR96]|uniref:tripartite tricarboxylate transporter substrate-binding protein n=1 Tax=Pseudomonas sp. HR96 TaxID=1027966 RepID=UPI002A74F1DB|nr:tripartite tricarboxylate transporter substrate-binding protein [Pseudomonas sp. HR96]WPO97720.1 tripartite tricarboxylate transporter substrate-binding protein [Pseudomonas sp. HR96]
MKRRSFVIGSAAALLAVRSARLFADNAAPTQRLIFGLPPGALGTKLATGALDILNGRAKSGYQLQVIDNRNTLQATETVKAAAPDGSTLLQVQSGSMTLFPSTYRNLKYDPMTDFTPLAVMGEYPFTLTLGPLVPASVTDVNGYLAWVQQNPDYRDLGFALYGSQSHLLALMLAREKEVALRAQSYKAATAMFGDLQNQNLAACITVPGNTLGLGKGCRTVAVSSATRLEGWPQVATFSEQGLPSLAMLGWYGWFAPAQLPAATAQSLRTQIAAAQATPEFLALLKRLLLTPAPLNPAQIHERMSLELVEYQRLVKSYGLTQMAEAQTRSPVDAFATLS